MASTARQLSLAKQHVETSETVYFSVSGGFELVRGAKRTFRTGVVMATEQRVIFYERNMVGSSMGSFPWESITSVEMSGNGEAFTLRTEQGEVSVKWVHQGDVNTFVDFVRKSSGPGALMSAVPVPV